MALKIKLCHHTEVIPVKQSYHMESPVSQAPFEDPHQ